MAFVCLDENNKVSGIFFSPQNPPKPKGYAVIEDNDPRIEEFLQLQINSQSNNENQGN